MRGVPQRSEYARICLDMFQICQGSENARVSQGSKYATI